MALLCLVSRPSTETLVRMLAVLIQRPFVNIRSFFMSLWGRPTPVRHHLAGQGWQLNSVGQPMPVTERIILAEQECRETKVKVLGLQL